MGNSRSSAQSTTPVEQRAAHDCGCDTEPCWKCGGVGFFDLYEEDPIAFAPGEEQMCDECGGHGCYVVHSKGCEYREAAP